MSPRAKPGDPEGKAIGPRTISYRDLRVWRTALSLIVCKEGDFEHPPPWLEYRRRAGPLAKLSPTRWDRS